MKEGGLIMPLRAKIVDLVVLLVSRVQKPAKTGRGGGSQESAHGVSMLGKRGEFSHRTTSDMGFL